jgi:hypothetical protein
MAPLSFDALVKLGLELPGVVEGTSYGARALKLNGQMLACVPVNKSAEVNCAVVRIGVEARAALIRNNPPVYYVTDHYAPHPTVLIRLSVISRTELQQTLRLAWDFLSAKKSAPRRARTSKPGVRAK